MKPRHWAIASGLCLLASCHVAEMSRDDWQAQVRRAYDPTEAAWPGESACYSGGLLCGSSVQFRVTCDASDEAREEWIVRLVAPRESAASGQRFTVFARDELAKSLLREQAISSVHEGEVHVSRAGVLQASDVAMLPIAALQAGLATSCEDLQAVEEVRDLPVGEVRRLSSSIVASIALSTVLRESSAARSLAQRFAQMPAWWKWIDPRLDITMSCDYARAEPLEFGGRPAWGIPVELRIKGDPAFYAWLVAVKPRGVLSMTAGVVCAVGFAPDRPERIVHVDLATAALGPEGVAAPRIAGVLRWVTPD